MSDRLVLRSAPEDGVVMLTLNRADKKNALSIAVRDEMSDAVDDLAGDEAVKTVVVTGAGNVFSAGFDLREFQ
jgi:enoyl-CoA hydratase/carnithine racemase